MAANPVKPVVIKNVDKSGRTRGQAYVLNYSKLFWVFIFGCVVGVGRRNAVVHSYPAQNRKPRRGDIRAFQSGLRFWRRPAYNRLKKALR